MAGNRLDLQTVLENTLGSNKVYFQPPSTVSLVYPCIIYKRDKQKDFHADNILYTNKKKYIVTVIDPDPDSEIPDRIMQLKYSSFNKHYAPDGLNHDVYELFF